MPTSIDKIVDGFPFPTIPPIFGTPTYNIIAEFNFKLNSNSASVQSNLSCGTLGLLLLTVSPAVYNTPYPSPLLLRPSTPALYPSSQTTQLVPKLPNFAMLSTPPPHSSTSTTAPTRLLEKLFFSLSTKCSSALSDTSTSDKASQPPVQS